METAVLLGQSASRVETQPTPALGAHDVLVALDGSGICASNIPVWEGRSWFTYPFTPGAPGHEGWGRVAAVGDAVTTVSRGDRVTMLSGRAFAEMDVAPESSVVRLPKTLDEQPFPGEPLACAVNAHARARIEPGSWVVIIGIGFMGAVMTRLAALAGARVIAVSRRPFAQALGKRFGAHASLPFVDAWQTAGAIKELTGDDMAPVVIEAVGSQSALDLATQVTGTHGRLVIAGYHQDGQRTVDVQQWNWKGIDVVNAHERDPQKYLDGMRQAIPLVANGSLPVGELLGEPLPLSRLDEAFRLAVERPDGFVKAVIDPRVSA